MGLACRKARIRQSLRQFAGAAATPVRAAIVDAGSGARVEIESSPKPPRLRTLPAVRYVVYDPKDPRKGSLLPDPELGQIVLGEGDTITKALRAADPRSGAVVWDRRERRVAYTVP